MFSESVIEETVEVEFYDEIADVDIRLTEAGSIDVDLSEKVEVNPGDDAEQFMGSDEPEMFNFDGFDASGYNLEFRNCPIQPSVRYSSDTSFFIKGVNPSNIVFDSTDGTPFVDTEVTVEIDVMCFTPSIPDIGRVEEHPLLEREGWKVYGYSLDNRDVRIEQIKELKRPLRTAKVEFKQEVNGPAERQVDIALDRFSNLVEIISFLQGVQPCPIRARITEIDGEKFEGRYERWMSSYSKDMGHSFKGEKLVWGDLRKFLDATYDDYGDRKRMPYRLHMVISWYLDALNNTRAVDSKFASLCNGIELLAKRHSDLGPCHSETQDRIEYMVEELEVDTKDLAEFSDTFESSKIEDPDYCHDYFYYKTRQYVMHGDNLSTTFDELFIDYEATLKFFQRLIATQLLGDYDDLDAYHKLRDLVPEDSRYDMD